jgi:hypothetical protein
MADAMTFNKVDKFLKRMTSYIFGTMVLGVVFAATIGAAGAASGPALKLTPGPYHDGQTINVSVGPNHYFKPYSRINILECADPGGKARNLPVNDTTCDGNTIQSNTILVQPNGSFSMHGYQLYALPNAPQLGELPDTRPICNRQKMCVLYVGQNQINFTAPKIFSPPFTISKSSKH